MSMIECLFESTHMNKFIHRKKTKNSFVFIYIFCTSFCVFYIFTTKNVYCFGNKISECYF